MLIEQIPHRERERALFNTKMGGEIQFHSTGWSISMQICMYVQRAKWNRPNVE